MYIADAVRNNVTKIPFLLLVAIINKGDDAIPTTEPNDTYLVIKTITKNIPKQVNAIIGFIPIIAPNDVATPFPPLNPKNTGQL